MRVLFAGPSIYGLSFDRSGFDLRPPAGCGDLLKAASGGATAIGLIDGVFASEPSVWHKEILTALAQGIPVYGAASMGALRAAECDAFGMIGVGQIYADYRRGARIADADVALLHGPAEMEFQPLTVALVDAEATGAQLYACGHFKHGAVTAFLDAARSMHFTNRSWSALNAASGIGRDLLERFKVEQKKLDAQALIARMAVDAKPAAIPTWRLNRTKYLTLLEKRVCGG